MKTFTKIPNEIGVKFAPNDVFALTVMYLTAKDDDQSNCFVTDVTIEQLVKLTGLSLGYIKDEFLPRLKDSKFCRIEHEIFGYKKRRNKYFLPNPERNFRIINSRVIINDIGLKPKEKGFLISLFTICENNTFNCGLNDKEIVDLLYISRSTYDRYKKILIQKGYLLYLEDDDFFDNCNYWRCLEIKCNWIGSTSDNELFLNTQGYAKASEFLVNRVSRFECA